MAQGLQLLTFSKVAITGSNWEAVSPISGDSATFFNVPQGSLAYIAEAWATDNLTPGDGVAGTAVALNAADNRLHANTDYALLGYTSNLAFGSLAISGIDTGNLKVGGPVLGLPEHDSQMFVDYAKAYNAPLIPII